MDFFTVQFYFLLLFVSSDILAMSIGNESSREPSPPVLEILGSNSVGSLKRKEESVRENRVEEAGFGGTLSEDVSPSSPIKYDGRKLSTPSQDLAWWPSKVDRFGVSSDIQRQEKVIARIVGEKLKLDRETRRRKSKPATFDELENRNANIYNPLLNLDHYPIAEKKYTVIELENMNANHYNPYLDK